MNGNNSSESMMSGLCFFTHLLHSRRHRPSSLSHLQHKSLDLSKPDPKSPNFIYPAFSSLALAPFVLLKPCHDSRPRRCLRLQRPSSSLLFRSSHLFYPFGLLRLFHLFCPGRAGYLHHSRPSNLRPVTRSRHYAGFHSSLPDAPQTPPSLPAPGFQFRDYCLSSCSGSPAPPSYPASINTSIHTSIHKAQPHSRSVPPRKPHRDSSSSSSPSPSPSSSPSPSFLRLSFPAPALSISSVFSILFPFLILLLALVYLPLPLYSQSGPSLLFRTLSIEQGLSQNSVLSIARDHQGFLWFGTESGLNKFDGYRFTVYLPVEGDPYSLSNSWINALLVDRNGNLWVGTENGLNKYDIYAEKFISYYHDPSDPYSLSSSRIFALFEDRDGRLWIGTDAGLNLFDPGTGRFTRFQQESGDSDLPRSSSLSSSSSFSSSSAFSSSSTPSTHSSARSSLHFFSFRTISNNQIRAIAQDARGFIWVGTVGGGLNRFDPATGIFTHFRHDPSDPLHSLPDDSIYSLLVNPSDPSAPIWIGTASSGLVRYDPDRHEFKTYRPDPHQPRSFHSLPDATVNCLVQDSDGTLWIGTSSGGLSHFYPERELFFNHRHQAHDPFSLADNNVVSLHLSSDRILWVGTYRGISQLNLHRQNFMRFLSNPNDPASLSHPEVRSFCDASSGLLWVGTDGGGLNVFDRNRMRAIYFRHDPKKPTSLSSDRVFSIVEDHDGLIWIGTDGGGLNRFDPVNSSFIHYRSQPRQPGSLPDDRIRTLFVDSRNNLWVGIDGSGLVQFDRRTGRFYRPRITRILTLAEALTIPGTGPSNDQNASGPASARSAPGDELEIASRAISGPSIIKPEIYLEDDSRQSNLPSSSWPGSKTADAGSTDAKSKGPKSEDAKSSDPRSTDQQSTDQQSIDPQYTAPQSDLASLSLRPGTSYQSLSNLGYSSTPLLSGRIFSLAEDQSGYLWIGCFGGGLVRYHPETGELLHLTHDPLNRRSLSSNSVITVYIDREGFIWVGTNGGALNRLDPSRLAFTRYNEAQGLPSSVIYGILEDEDGYLWLSSNRGLSQLDPRTGQIKNFDTTDGLQSYEFNGNACHKGRDGLLYFGGINGFNVFNPIAIRPSEYRPPVVITSLMISNIPVKPGHLIDGYKVLDKSISRTDEIVLYWKHRVISFEFAGLDYNSPEKNQYAYILKGFEDKWNYVGNRRFASYSNLPPGRYTFHVKAANCDGIWNEEGASLRLRIIPPFWRTWWFYVMSVLALAGAIWEMVQLRLKQICHRQEELERLVAQRTEELRLANDRLELLATTDELTGLANYRRFRDFLEYEWRRAIRTRRPLSLIIADLDDFKLFNDTYGHQAGDECLKKVAMVMLKSCQRSSDLACRYGGDEFAVVLPETDTAGAYIVAERIREAVVDLDLNELNFTEINSEKSVNKSSQPLRLMISVGVATMNPAEGGDTNELIARADKALYRAKGAGKNHSIV